jgi:hypothetical protein
MNISLMNRSNKFLALLGLLGVMVAGCSSSPATVVPAKRGLAHLDPGRAGHGRADVGPDAACRPVILTLARSTYV